MARAGAAAIYRLLMRHSVRDFVMHRTIECLLDLFLATHTPPVRILLSRFDHFGLPLPLLIKFLYIPVLPYHNPFFR